MKKARPTCAGIPGGEPCDRPVAISPNGRRCKRCAACKAKMAAHWQRARRARAVAAAAPRPPSSATCADCGTSIADRGAAALRCEPCALEAKKRWMRDYQKALRSALPPKPPLHCCDCGTPIPRTAGNTPRRRCDDCRERRATPPARQEQRCGICDEPIRSGRPRYCSDDCALEAKRRNAREHARRKRLGLPSPPRPPRRDRTPKPTPPCAGCGGPIGDRPASARFCLACTEAKGRDRNRANQAKLSALRPPKRCIDCDAPIPLSNRRPPKRCEPCRKERQAEVNRQALARFRAASQQLGELRCIDCDEPMPRRPGAGAQRKRCDDCRQKASKARDAERTAARRASKR